jgi:hypothetical protein
VDLSGFLDIISLASLVKQEAAAKFSFKIKNSLHDPLKHPVFFTRHPGLPSAH